MKARKWMSLVCVLCMVLCLFGGCAKPTIATVDNVMVNTEGMTDLQKAIVITAESYYLRGARAQYDQKAFTKSTGRAVNRRTTGLLKPEDYTEQAFSYHDCSSFAFDVYWSALGFDFSEGWTKRNTKSFIDNQYSVLKEYPERDFGSLSIEEIEQKEQEFRDALQPGDVIVYRKRGNSAGHAMVYVGNDRMIHSSGRDFGTISDRHEATGTYLHDSVEETLLSEGATRYLMTVHSYTILRPLNGFEGEIPADTVSRIGAMRGIMAEKLSSHTYGQTANLGEEITFTFHIENFSEGEKTLTITDTVPALTTYVSGADTVEGDTLKWTVTLAAGENKDVSYKVKVTGDKAAIGKTIRSESTIEAVAVNCREITIGNTLTKDQQAALTQAFAAKAQEGLLGMELVNAAYSEAVGYEAFPGVAVEDVNAQVFTQWGNPDMEVDPTLAYGSWVAPRLYGGMFVVEQAETDEEKIAKNAYRTRLLKEHLLVAGDYITADNEGYVYTGEAILDLATGAELPIETIEMFGSYYAFAVLRPSLAQQ